MFNESASISQLVGALNDQTDRRFTACFVDGGSSDQTVNTLRQIYRNFDNSIFVFTDNLGISRNWKRAAEVSTDRAQASHVCFIGADDLVDSNFVETVLQSASKFPDRTIVPEFRSEDDSYLTPILPQELSIRMLYRNWSLVHLVFSVFPFIFFRERVLPVLSKSSSPGFDWWITYLTLRESDVILSDGALYLRRKKVPGKELDSGVGPKSRPRLTFHGYTKVLIILKSFLTLDETFRKGEGMLDELGMGERIEIRVSVSMSRILKMLAAIGNK
jgi:glycosyltransferase involved in cell wall biosynthesis